MITCADLKCVLGEKGPFRTGHEDVLIHEVPYIVMLRNEEEEFPYCLGTILNTEVVLTTCKCVHNYNSKDNEIETKSPSTIEVLSSSSYLKSSSLQVRRGYSIYSLSLCKIRNDFDGNDLALIVVRPMFVYETSAMFIRSRHADILKSEKERMILLNNCFGFGFGRYNFLSDISINKLEGRASAHLQKFDYNLISDEDCSKLMPVCCPKTDAPKRFAPHGLSCLIRGRINSKCFGEAGSPIVCGGYVFGLLKGHMKCVNDVDRAGPDIMIDFHFNQNLNFILDHLTNTIGYDPPVIKPLQQKPSPAPRVPPNTNTSSSSAVNSTKESDIDAAEDNKLRRPKSPFYYTYDTPDGAVFTTPINHTLFLTFMFIILLK